MTRALHLAAIRRLDAMFERAGIDYWIFGGWAVDFHAGRVTRDHADIDVAIRHTDLDVAERLLVAEGWTRSPATDDEGYATYTRDGVQIDLAYVAIDGLAAAPATPEGGDWPPDSFGSDIRELRTTRARVVGLSSLIADKSRPHDDLATRTKDEADVAVLRSVVGK